MTFRKFPTASEFENIIKQKEIEQRPDKHKLIKRDLLKLMNEQNDSTCTIISLPNIYGIPNGDLYNIVFELIGHLGYQITWFDFYNEVFIKWGKGIKI
jgi:hypothetical protein